MFVRVKSKDAGLHFTVVDIVGACKEGRQELELILDLGLIHRHHLDNEQCWYLIAENLIAADLPENEKKLLARDISNWLPPLSLEGLLQARVEDMQQLAALSTCSSQAIAALPTGLNKNDPLTIIAGWLSGE